MTAIISLFSTLFHAVTQDKWLPRLNLIRLQMNTIKGGIGF